MGPKKTHDVYVKEVEKIAPNIKVIGTYIGAHTKIKHRCLICDYEWDAQPTNILQGYGCPRCAGNLKLNIETYRKLLAQIHPNIEIMNEYIDDRTKIKCKCLICGHDWERNQYYLLRSKGCPKCAHTGDSYMQRFIYYSFAEVYNNVLYRDTTLIGMELDIVIPDIKLAIEPGGWYWHKNRVDKDLEKRDKVIAKGYNIITIYDVFDELEKPYEDCMVFEKDLHEDDKRNGKLLENLVKDLFKQLGIEQEVDFDKVREECK